MKILFAFLLGIAAFPAIGDLSDLIDNKFETDLGEYTVFPRYGFTKAFSGNCTKDVSKNGHGWEFVRREYFSCGTLNIMISDALYGEYAVKPKPKAKMKNPQVISCEGLPTGSQNE